MPLDNAPVSSLNDLIDELSTQCSGNISAVTEALVKRAEKDPTIIVHLTKDYIYRIAYDYVRERVHRSRAALKAGPSHFPITGVRPQTKSDILASTNRAQSLSYKFMHWPLHGGLFLESATVADIDQSISKRLAQRDGMQWSIDFETFVSDLLKRRKVAAVSKLGEKDLAAIEEKRLS